MAYNIPAGRGTSVADAPIEAVVRDRSLSSRFGIPCCLVFGMSTCCEDGSSASRRAERAGRASWARGAASGERGGRAAPNQRRRSSIALCRLYGLEPRVLTSGPEPRASARGPSAKGSACSRAALVRVLTCAVPSPVLAQARLRGAGAGDQGNEYAHGFLISGSALAARRHRPRWFQRLRPGE